MHLDEYNLKHKTLIGCLPKSEAEMNASCPHNFDTPILSIFQDDNYRVYIANLGVTCLTRMMEH